MIEKKTFDAIELCVILAAHANQRNLATPELSKRMGMSVSYIESVLKVLKAGQFVRAVRGPGGGYTIHGDTSRVSLWDIAVAFEPNTTAAQGEVASPHADLAGYEIDLQRLVQDTLAESCLSDFVDHSSQTIAPSAPGVGRFKFKPLALPLIPKVPNSVFQLHMAN